ncbi:MAG: hypothetical protein U0176_07770 [Bacteroidia bacterium]
MATFSVNAHRLEFADRYTRLVVKADDLAVSSYRLDDEDNSVSIQIIGSNYQVMEAQPIEDQDSPDRFYISDGGFARFSEGSLDAMGMMDHQAASGELTVQYDLHCGPVRLAAQRRNPHSLLIKPFDRQCLQVENN